MQNLIDDPSIRINGARRPRKRLTHEILDLRQVAHLLCHRRPKLKIHVFYLKYRSI